MEVGLATSLLLREPDSSFVPSELTFALGTPVAGAEALVSGPSFLLVVDLRGVDGAPENPDPWGLSRVPRHPDHLANVLHPGDQQKRLVLSHQGQCHVRHDRLGSLSYQEHLVLLGHFYLREVLPDSRHYHNVVSSYYFCT